MVTTPQHRPTLMDRIRHRADDRNEDGSLLLDLVLGMVIFGLIALIGMQLPDKVRAFVGQMSAESDAGKIAQGIEMNYTSFSMYPDALTGDNVNGSDPFNTRGQYGADLKTLDGAVLSRGNAINGYATVGGGTGFKFCVERRNGNPATPIAWAVYRTDKGGLAESGRGGGCASASAMDAFS